MGHLQGFRWTIFQPLPKSHIPKFKEFRLSILYMYPKFPVRFSIRLEFQSGSLIMKIPVGHPFVMEIPVGHTFTHGNPGCAYFCTWKSRLGIPLHIGIPVGHSFTHGNPGWAFLYTWESWLGILLHMKIPVGHYLKGNPIWVFLHFTFFILFFQLDFF